MLRLALVLALVLAAAANAAGPSPGLLQGPAGITTPVQKYRFVTLHGPRATKLAAIDKATGRVVRSRSLRGEWGIPYVTLSGTVDGLSRDGKTLVIADWVQAKNSPFRPRSSFRIYGTNMLDLRSRFTLRGDFSFDALSRTRQTLYLIQHVGERERRVQVPRSRVRPPCAAIAPQVIADKRQQGWIMRGLPMKRLASTDGRWVYTLYRQDGGYPFVHALTPSAEPRSASGSPGRATRTRSARPHSCSQAGSS